MSKNMSSYVTLVSNILIINFLHCFLSHSCIFSISVNEVNSDHFQPERVQDKLLVILLDGFRWDYYNKYRNSLKGFQRFLSQGVQAERVKTVFPSLSYPAWTTISTGVYPETHGVTGNYMFNVNGSDPNQSLFNLTDTAATAKSVWWQNSEPIWITAERHKKTASLFLWSRCDVPYHGIGPSECTGYQESLGVESMRNSFYTAAQKLQLGFDLVMVYAEYIDDIGHTYGPDSMELQQALTEVDNALDKLQNELIHANLNDKVNIVIVSDHGMAWTAEDSGVTYIDLDNYLDHNEIYLSLDRGAVMSIIPFPQHYYTVLNALKGVEGITVYQREEIPEEYHYKNGWLVPNILLVAKEKYLIRGLQTEKQIPRDCDPKTIWKGFHGYPPNMTDMRTIFFAKGPAFKKGIVHPPINLEDEYQIFAKLLNIPAQPHNGSWSRVEDMLISTQK